MSKALRHAIEYAAARAALTAMRAVSPATGCRLAAGAADAAFALLTSRRRIAIDNIRRAGLAEGAAAHALARAAFRHFAGVLAESCYTPTLITAENWPQFATLDAPPETRALLADPAQGVLLVSGHLGNWEAVAQILSFIKPLTVIARRMNNPRVQALMEARNLRGNLATIDKHSANPRQLLRVLREGRVLALLSDQHASSKGLRIDFFGRPAATYTSPAILHRLSGAPILFVTAIRTGLLRYRMTLSEPLRYPSAATREEDVRLITQDLAARLEAAVRVNPEQYLWSHRRWKEPAPAG